DSISDIKNNNISDYNQDDQRQLLLNQIESLKQEQYKEFKDFKLYDKKLNIQ
ncbi:15270_t:CDS:1, partial [Racocetra persica]